MFRKHTERAIRLAQNSKVINDEMVIELSKACHYLEDLCETHHVTNKVAMVHCHLYLRKIDQTIISNHSEFEKYKITSVNDFKTINTLHKGEKQFWSAFDYYGQFLTYSYLRNRCGDNAFLQLCDWYAGYSSDFASGVGSIYHNNLKNGMEIVNLNVTGDYNVRNAKNWERSAWALSQNINDWNKNIEQTLKLSQVSVAIFLFNFLLYLEEPSLFNFPLKD